MHSWLPVFAILVSALAVIPIAMNSSRPNVREGWTFAAGFIKLGIIAYMAKWVMAGNVYDFTLVNILPNLSLALKVDAFGLLFAFVASSLWIVTSAYSIGYMRSLKEHAQTRYFCFFALALSATIGVAFSANLLTLYLFYELLSLSTYPLVTHHQDKDARTGGRKYLTYLLGTSVGLVLPAMIIPYMLTGTLTFSEMGVYGSAVSGTTLLILLLMFLFGFAKAGIMPFHAWLPGAMVAPTPVSALLHAVAVVKVGVFCVLRIITGIFGTQLLTTTGLNTVICVIAGITVIVASLIALSQDNLKRLLAYSTVGQLSYIIMGAGLATQMGVKGSMMHIAMHGFGKITLFMCAGAIYVATKKKNISDMVGIGRKMPFTMVAFLLGSLSVIGLPPAGGLISKWYMVLGAMDAQMTWVVVIYMVSSLLNAAYFFPIIYRAFFCADKDSQFKGGVKEAPAWAMVPPVFTGVVSVVLLIYPQPFFKLATIATAYIGL